MSIVTTRPQISGLAATRYVAPKTASSTAADPGEARW
ncbi:hypothetical protein MYBA111488_16975 [Mycobacterium basiliense]